MRYLLAGEPQSTFKPDSDTGVALAAEILKRGIPLDYCDLSQVDWRAETSKYLGKLPVANVEKVRMGEKNPLDLGHVKKVHASQYAVILQRKDPPVDEVYEGHASHFAKLPSHIIQMNNPQWTPRLSEHLLPQKYPEFSTPTHQIGSLDELISVAEKLNTKIVAKPSNLFSGIGITFFDAKPSREALEQFWEKWKPQVILQPFIPEIETLGDLRILVMNRKIVGSVLRKPKAGSLLGNFHQGATAHPFDPTPKQLQAVEAVAADLTPKGLYLLGLDFIGDYLNEVNITCPTTVLQINQVMGIHGEKIIVDELESLRRKATGTT